MEEGLRICSWQKLILNSSSGSLRVIVGSLNAGTVLSLLEIKF